VNGTKGPKEVIFKTDFYSKPDNIVRKRKIQLASI